MELQQKVEMLEQQIRQYIETTENLNNEKTAIDQSYVQQIQLNLDLRKQILVKDKFINGLNNQIQSILQEKADLEDVCTALEDQIGTLRSKLDLTEI